MAMLSSTTLTPTDNHTGSVDHAILTEINRKQGELLLPVILYIVVAMVMGTLGNPLAIYIYVWRWKHTTTRCFLLWLACSDLLNCLITMPTEVYFLTYFYYTPNGQYCLLARFSTYVINSSTYVVYVAIAIDHFIRICHPLRSPMSVFGAKIACGISLILGVGMSWPAIFLYGRRVISIPTSKSSRGHVYGAMCGIRNDMDDTLYPFAFYISLFCVAGGSFFTISMLYILIGRVILKRRRAKDNLRALRLNEQTAFHGAQSSNENTTPATALHELQSNDKDSTSDEREHPRKSNDSGKFNCLKVQLPKYGPHDVSSLSALFPKIPKSTLMLFAITMVFVISFLPFLIIMIVRQYVGSSFYTSLSPAMEVVVNIFSRSYLVNNSTNAIVYGLCNSQFRDEVRKIFPVCTQRRNSRLSQEETKFGLSESKEEK